MVWLTQIDPILAGRSYVHNEIKHIRTESLAMECYSMEHPPNREEGFEWLT